MPCNEGPIDRIIRIVIGLGIISLAFIGPHTPWAWLGLIPLLTGITGFCGLYALLGINTCKNKNAS